MEERTTTYYLLLKQSDDYVVMECDENKEVIEDMFKWYQAHKKFFNGDFVIEERNF